MLSFSLQAPQKDKVIDIEDLEKRTRYISQTPNFPLLMEVPVVKGETFFSDEDISEKIKLLRSVHPPNRKVNTSQHFIHSQKFVSQIRKKVHFESCRKTLQGHKDAERESCFH